jgi:FMN-dependent NADH-azoreductase
MGQFLSFFIDWFNSSIPARSFALIPQSLEDIMKTLLSIHTSLYGAAGQSSRLAERFIEDWRARNPGGRVLTRDLAAHPVPHLTVEEFQAFGTSPAQRTQQQRAAVAYSDALIAELASADTIVLAVPMYNFSVPSTLRAYFDHVARAGITFRYTSSGPEGLLKGRHAYVFITRGGVYSEAVDTQTPYLRQFLSFIGIEAHFIHAEGLAMGEPTRERSLSAAREAIVELAYSERAA